MNIAIVTGASSGIGREFAKQISARYSKFDEIWLIARRSALMDEYAPELKLTARIISMDLSDDDELNGLRSILEEKKPEIKLLVNCAGCGRVGKTEDIPYDEQLMMIDVNCRALTAVTSICFPYISENSRIINVASASAFMPQPNFAIYAATKAYVLSYSRALRQELKHRKVSVTCVCPGPVDTEFFEKAGNSVKFFKSLVMAKPEHVVEQAIRDAAFNNELSIYGKTMKFAHWACRFLPQRVLMKLF